MIKYGGDGLADLQFAGFRPVIERRDSQWIDIVLRPRLANPANMPDDVVELSVLVICTVDGTIVQIVPQDEDTDCEYSFTVGEKEQIASFVGQTDIQAAIAALSRPPIDG